MKLANRWIVIGLLLLSIAGVVSAEEFVGGLGTNWVSSAMTIPPGSALINVHGRLWMGTVKGDALKNGVGSVNLNFGYTRDFELGFSQILYQDYNWANPPAGSIVKADESALPDKFMAPGDISLRWKYGNIGTNIGDLYLINAISGGIRYRVGRLSNIPYYPYFSSGITPSISWLTSWYERPLYPDESKFFGLQMTYTHHNDVEKNATSATQSFMYSMAYHVPVKNMQVGAQVHGMVFAKMPQVGAYSREPYAYFSPYINIRLFEGVEWFISPEFLLNKARNTTNNKFDNKNAPNYEPWRLSGIVRISPSTTFYSNDPFAKTGQGRRGGGSAALRDRLSRESRSSLFDWTVDTERDLQFLNLDLEKTRIERQRAEEELLKLKKELGK